jgi:hypothetical protein
VVFLNLSRGREKNRKIYKKATICFFARSEQIQVKSIIGKEKNVFYSTITTGQLAATITSMNRIQVCLVYILIYFLKVGFCNEATSFHAERCVQNILFLKH